MRRAIVGWGLGHVTLGDARGWLLLGLEIVWLATIGASLPFLPTDRGLLVYLLLAGFLGIWVTQAVLAYRRAALRSGPDGGAIQLAAVLPVAMLVLTAYWSAGGANASPDATLQRFVSAWESDHAERALDLLAEPGDVDTINAAWDADTDLITARVADITAQHPEWDLDTLRPYRDLRFEPLPRSAADPSHASYAVQLVRQAQVPTSFLGIFSATRSETRVVDVLGEVTLVRRPVAVALPLSGDPPGIWLVERVDIPASPS